MARYDLTRFRATHNSYSGGARGSLRQQLDDGVRCLEFDVHDNGYDEVGDYRVGHLKPGMEVDCGDGSPNANPATFFIRQWLAVIDRWSTDHPGHAPITLVLDVKDDLGDNDEGGHLGDFNKTLRDVFQAKLFTRDEFDVAGAWPELADLRNRIICVVSGDGATRASYRWAFGTAPALSANAGGDLALVYRSPAGDLNIWTGAADAATADAAWTRKSTYAFENRGVKEFAVAITGDRWIVALHAFMATGGGPETPLIEAQVGHLRDDGRITWSSPSVFAQGTNPTIALDGDRLRVIHTGVTGDKRQEVLGTLDRKKKKVEWDAATATTAKPLTRDTAQWQGHTLRCRADQDEVIGYGADGGAFRPVRLAQVAFVEMQHDEEQPSLRDAKFFAAGAKNADAIKRARTNAFVVRAWDFAEEDLPHPPATAQENMAATNAQKAPWYVTYLTGTDVAD